MTFKKTCDFDILSENRGTTDVAEGVKSHRGSMALH